MLGLYSIFIYLYIVWYINIIFQYLISWQSNIDLHMYLSLYLAPSLSIFLSISIYLSLYLYHPLSLYLCINHFSFTDTICQAFIIYHLYTDRSLYVCTMYVTVCKNNIGSSLLLPVKLSLLILFASFLVYFFSRSSDGYKIFYTFSSKKER